MRIHVKKRFIDNARSSALQLVINQGAGLLVFCLLSQHLGKTGFGEINWTLAVYLTLFNILPFGLDQVMVQKIASGTCAPSMPPLYFFHAFASGLVCYALIVLGAFAFPQFFQHHSLLLFFGFGKLLLYFSTPFKQLVAGQEKFNLLLYMSIGSSLAKAAAFSVLAGYGQLHMQQAVLVFVAADGLELLASFAVYRYRAGAQQAVPGGKTGYLALLKECLPQAGVAFFASALSRLDWIMVGLFLTAAKLGEYSFAYKVFECATLPLLVVAPLLVPLFSRYATAGKTFRNEARVKLLLRVELIIAGLTVLLLNVLWTPAMDTLTQGRYGKINASTIFFLSLSLPVLYLNNFLWSLHFAAGRRKKILRIFAVAFAVNLGLNALLIPWLHNEGAAIAFSLSMLVQTILYAAQLESGRLFGWSPAIGCLLAALGSAWIGRMIFSSLWLVLCSSIACYLLLILLALPFRPGWHRLRTRLAALRSNP